MSQMPTEMEVRTYYQTASAAFERAMKTASQPESHFYRLGDLVFCMHFAGPALVPRLTPALQHLRIDPIAKPDLQIGVWDAASTGVKLAPPTQDPTDFVARMEIKGYTTASVQVTYEIGGGVLNMLDSTSQTALFWVLNAEQVPYYESGAPLRSILATWMQSHQYQYLHAAAIGTTDGAVILAGKGGSGKSTAALNGLFSGLFYLSDDYCVAKLTPTPTVYNLYNSGKLDSDTILRFPQISDFVQRIPHIEAEKILFFLQDQFQHRLRPCLPIKAILLPQISSQSSSTIQRTSPAEGLAALAPSTIFQLPGAGKDTFQFIAELVRQIPVY